MGALRKLFVAVFALLSVSACTIGSDSRIMPAGAAITPLPREAIFVAFAQGDQPTMFTLRRNGRSYLLTPPAQAGMKPFPVTFYPLPGASGFMIIAVEDTTEQKSGFIYALGKAGGDVLDIYNIGDADALSAHGTLVGGKYTGMLKIGRRADLEAAMREMARAPDRLATEVGRFRVFDAARGGKAAAEKFHAEQMAIFAKQKKE